MSFSQTYKSYATAQLLRIIERAEDYQPAAVEAAKAEMDSRLLSDEELLDAQAELAAEKEQQNVKQQKAQQRKERISQAANLLTARPGKPFSATKAVNLIAVVFGVLFLIYLILEIRTIGYTFIEIADGKFFMAISILPFIYIPLTLVMFFQKKRVGWILVTIYLTYSAIAAAGTMIMTFNAQPSGIPALDQAFPIPSSVSLLLCLLFFVGTLAVMCRKSIRELFAVTRRMMVWTIAISVVATIANLILTTSI